MSAPDTPAPYAPQPLDAAEGHGNPPSQAAPESTTRRGLFTTPARHGASP